MANDDTHHRIDRAYDFADRVVDGVGRVLGVDTSVPTTLNVKRDRIERSPARTMTGKQALALPAVSTATVGGLEFRIDETSSRGRVSWVVTNGVDRVECSSRDLAGKVLEALGKLGKLGACK